MIDSIRVGDRVVCIKFDPPEHGVVADIRPIGSTKYPIHVRMDEGHNRTFTADGKHMGGDDEQNLFFEEVLFNMEKFEKL